MFKKILPVEPTLQKVRIPSAAGDVRISGWEREEISARTDGEVLNVGGDVAEMVLECDGDLVLSLPRRLALDIGSIGGDADLRNLAGGVTVGEVEGDLSLRLVRAATIGAVHGDLEARESGPLTVDVVHADLNVKGGNGDLLVRSVNGDVSLQEIHGNVNLGSVADDLYVREVSGNLQARVEEDAVLHLRPAPGQVIEVSAESDILLHLSPQTSAHLTLTAGRAEDIRVEMPGVPKRDGSNPRTVTLGSGEATIVLKAEGDVMVTSREAGWGGAAEDDFSGNRADWDDLGRQIRHRVEEKIRRAGRQAGEAVRRGGRGFWFRWGSSSSVLPSSRPGARSPEPVSDEERLFILRMLQEKKITAEEAATLLAALEGEEL